MNAVGTSERFWEKVDVRGEDKCWLWLASRFSSGYGQFGFDGRPQNAHRVAWQLIYGTISSGLYVLHKCDNKPCVNPAHLFLGTPADNTRDMLNKGRNPKFAGQRGEDNYNVKLTEGDVLRIVGLAREGQLLRREIAERYNISQRQVYYILSGKWWGWLTGINKNGRETNGPD